MIKYYIHKSSKYLWKRMKNRISNQSEFFNIWRIGQHLWNNETTGIYFILFFQFRNFQQTK